MRDKAQNDFINDRVQVVCATNRTTKRSAEELSAFWSYNYPPLAEVGVNITYHPAQILPPAGDPTEPLRIAERLSGDVMVLKLYPGIDERIGANFLHSHLDERCGRGYDKGEDKNSAAGAAGWSMKDGR